MRVPSSSTRGSVVLVTAMSLAFLVPVLGLGIDTGMLYAVKAKLSAAVDAASLASARSLSMGRTAAEQEAGARNAARRFFRANFPDGCLGTRNLQLRIDIGETGVRTRTVTTTASVDAPSYFLRVLGFSTTRVSAQGKAARPACTRP